MNDHNLDDLIIDTPTKKGGKVKGFLTITALFIVVLIVAIILTRIILKDPGEDHAALLENDTEIISPELTLQHTDEESKQDEIALSEMIKEEMEAPQKASETLSEKTTDTHTEKVAKKETVVNEEKQPESLPRTKTAATLKKPEKKPLISKASTAKKEHAGTAAETTSLPKVKAVTKQKPKKITPAKNEHNTFYIQVGSFSKAPSSDSRLITAIKKQGYRYKIITANGMKKVLVGPYKSRADVDRALARIRDLINKSAFVVKK